MAAPEQRSDPTSNSNTWRSFLIWALIALLVRWVVIEPRWIPSGSMLPTLQLQDRILVEKIRPSILLLKHDHLKSDSIVVFSPPTALIQAGYDPKAALIKRVVGQPGDQLEVRDGQLLRNGQRMEESWLSEPMAYDMPPVTVPSEQLWVMGDNRNASLDSHLWGPLPEKNVIGTAVWRYWPLRRFGPIRVPDRMKGRPDPDPAVRSGP